MTAPAILDRALRDLRAAAIVRVAEKLGWRVDRERARQLAQHRSCTEALDLLAVENRHWFDRLMAVFRQGGDTARLK